MISKPNGTTCTQTGLFSLWTESSWIPCCLSLEGPTPSTLPFHHMSKTNCCIIYYFKDYLSVVNSKYDTDSNLHIHPGSSLPTSKGTTCPSLWGTAWCGETNLTAVQIPPTAAHWTRWVPRVPLSCWYMVVGLWIAVSCVQVFISTIHHNSCYRLSVFISIQSKQ